MELCQAVSENTGCRDQDQNDRQSVNTSVKRFPYALPCESLVDEHRDEQRVNNCDRSRLSSRENTGDNADNDDQDRSERPDTGCQLLQKLRDAERFSLRVLPLH